MSRADKVSFHLGQSAFRPSGIPKYETFTDEKTEDRVAEEFELFVVDGGWVGRFLPKRKRAMRESADQQVPVTESVAKSSFQFLQVRCGHDYFAGGVVGAGAVWRRASRRRSSPE